MADPTEVYVDPSIAGDSGTGTIGDPFGDLQYALDNTTRNSTDGDRFNIKAGTDEVLSAAIDLTTYGTPAGSAPLILQGYTSSAGDGGVGGISGNGSVGVYSGSSGLYFIDLHLHNCGSTTILSMTGADGAVHRCELDNTTGNGISISERGFNISGCHIHNIGGIGIDGNSARGGLIYGNYLANGTNDFSDAINVSLYYDVRANIITIDGASNGIVLGSYARAFGNSILSNAGTGDGINSAISASVFSNLVEGFSGTGGVGIVIDGVQVVYTANAVYNCATAYSVTENVFVNFGDNESLSASPFAKSGSDTFANRFTYFAPVDTGNVIGGAYQ